MIKRCSYPGCAGAAAEPAPAANRHSRPASGPEPAFGSGSFLGSITTHRAALSPCARSGAFAPKTSPSRCQPGLAQLGDGTSYHSGKRKGTVRPGRRADGEGPCATGKFRPAARTPEQFRQSALCQAAPPKLVSCSHHVKKKNAFDKYISSHSSDNIIPRLRYGENPASREGPEKSGGHA